MKTLYRGDSWRLYYTIYDSSGQPLNLAGWQVRAELVNTKRTISIKKASSNVSGGGVDQIEVVDVSNGKILIKFSSSETQNLTGTVILEVEIENPTQGLKYTVVREQFEVIEDIVQWTTK